MRKSRFKQEQIIAILAEQERRVPTADVCRKHGLSRATFYKSKQNTAGWTSPTPGSRSCSRSRTAG
jgi:putative transposase